VAHLLVAAGAVALIACRTGAVGTLVGTLLMGHSFAGLAFVGHEVLHGAVVRRQGPRMVLGWLCFLPFVVSPRLWVAWHNQVHHSHTMEEGVDPDAYPTLEEYRSSRLLRVIDRFSLGRFQPGGLFCLALGFTVQSGQVLFKQRSLKYLTPKNWRRALMETTLGVAAWTAFGVWGGPRLFVFAFLLPLAIGNAVVTAYILTNHSLSPLTEVNDPLLNSLSVTLPWWLSKLHLDFGLHVEHHLFPAVSSAHAETVRAAVVRRWPERYQSMPFLRALGRLISTPRIYKEPRTLVDPKSGREFPTLAGIG